jgi:ParB-like chromosome segregation protein Spo0J
MAIIHHPVASLFPMMDQDGLRELAADITTRGQLQPIILDGQGRILDGRNRWAACQIAGAEPVTEVYEGADPAGYALAVNLERRSLTPSQRHMIREMARRQAERSKVQISTSDRDSKSLSEAATVLDHAPDLASLVAAGQLKLYQAVQEARERKARAKALTGHREQLGATAPDLAERVDDDGDSLTLSEAMAIMDSRRTEQERARAKAEQDLAEQKRDARELLDRIVRLTLPASPSTGWIESWAEMIGPDDLLAAQAEEASVSLAELAKRMMTS